MISWAFIVMAMQRLVQACLSFLDFVLLFDIVMSGHARQNDTQHTVSACMTTNTNLRTYKNKTLKNVESFPAVGDNQYDRSLHSRIFKPVTSSAVDLVKTAKTKICNNRES